MSQMNFFFFNEAGYTLLKKKRKIDLEFLQTGTSQRKCGRGECNRKMVTPTPFRGATRAAQNGTGFPGNTDPIEQAV